MTVLKVMRILNLMIFILTIKSKRYKNWKKNITKKGKCKKCEQFNNIIVINEHRERKLSRSKLPHRVRGFSTLHKTANVDAKMENIVSSLYIYCTLVVGPCLVEKHLMLNKTQVRLITHIVKKFSTKFSESIFWLRQKRYPQMLNMNIAL